MDISLTAVTANRLLGKALGRNAAPLDRLRACAHNVGTEGSPFNTLQVVIVDEEESFLRVKSAPKGSTLLQVLVGLPASLTFRPAEDASLLTEIGKRVLDALEASGLPDSTKRQAVQRVSQWIAAPFEATRNQLAN
jgi:hypothetical protein